MPPARGEISVAPMRKRSLVIAGHRTSLALEQPFWEALEEMAAEQGLSLSALVAEIDRERGSANLASAARLAVLAFHRRKGRG